MKSENPGLTIGDTAKKLGEMWNSKTAEDKQPYEKKAAKLKEKYDKVTAHCPNTGGKMVSFATKKYPIRYPQDIVAYRTKGKVDSESAATADDDEEEDEEEEEEDDDDEDDDE